MDSLESTKRAQAWSVNRAGEAKRYFLRRLCSPAVSSMRGPAVAPRRMSPSVLATQDACESQHALAFVLRSSHPFPCRRRLTIASSQPLVLTIPPRPQHSPALHLSQPLISSSKRLRFPILWHLLCLSIRWLGAAHLVLDGREGWEGKEEVSAALQNRLSSSGPAHASKRLNGSQFWPRCGGVRLIINDTC